MALRLQIGAPVDVVAGPEVVVLEVVDKEELLGVITADVVDAKLDDDVEVPMGPMGDEAETELVDEDVEVAVEPRDEVDTGFVVEEVDVEAPMGPADEADDALVDKLDVDVELLIGPTDDDVDAEVVDDEESEVEEVLSLTGPPALLDGEEDTAMLDTEVEVMLWEVEDVEVTVEIEVADEMVVLMLPNVVVVLMLPDVVVLLLVEMADADARNLG